MATSSKRRSGASATKAAQVTKAAPGTKRLKGQRQLRCVGLRAQIVRAASVRGKAVGAAKKSPRGGARTKTSASSESRSVPFEALNEVSPSLMRSQNAWLAQIDSLRAPDRKTHELIRMVCSVVARNPQGIRHHAMLAAEVGASWEEVAGSVILAEPAFGILVVVEAFPWARKGWERGASSAGDPDREVF